MMEDLDSDSRGMIEGKCQACDSYGLVDDVMLCESCSSRFERDMIRQRRWDYSALTFGLSAVDCEKLRKEVIKTYGAECEMVLPDGGGAKENH